MTFQPRVWFVWVRERKEESSVVGINVPVRRPHTLAHARNEIHCLAGERETLRSACCVVGAQLSVPSGAS